ncbi:MAG: dihydrofolate reductase [Niastella sp.]|nr:dihydrofolate reductase [Niastella sp.]
MRKLILLAHVSLDGFVAGKKGELDGFPSGEENLQFVCDLTKGADAALFGRNSYQLLESWWPTAGDAPNASAGVKFYSDWYNRAQKIVVSRTLADASLNNTIVVSTDIPNKISKIKEQPGGNILIFGSPATSRLLMKHNLIDDYWIFINSVTFGEGIPLFSEETGLTKFKLAAAHPPLPNGEVPLHYTR